MSSAYPNHARNTPDDVSAGGAPYRPSDARLAEHLDRHIAKGDEVRYVDARTVTVYVENRAGCLFWTFIILLALVTFGIALLFGVLALAKPGGRLITYRLTDTGRIKRTMRGVSK